MERRGHVLLAVLAGTGFFLTVFQVWYVALPDATAATVDICRIAKAVNCYNSLHAHGPDLALLGIPVIPALCGLFGLMFALAGYALVGPDERSGARAAAARLVAFPTTGLAVYLLLSDITVAKATSVSGILVSVAAVGIASDTILNGLRGDPRGARGAEAGLLVAMLAAVFCMNGAVQSSRAVDAITIERAEGQAGIVWPRFLHDLPRKGAARLGRWTAPHEIVLLVDPDDPASREAMRQAADVMPRYADRLLLTIYAKGPRGAELILAQRNGTLAEYLRTAKPPQGDPASVADLLKRQTTGWPKDAGALPAAFTRHETSRGRIDLATLAEAALAR